jgi:hypothetical protein
MTSIRNNWTLIATSTLGAMTLGAAVILPVHTSLAAGAQATRQAANPRGALVIALGGQARHDLARTLKPLDFTSGETVLHLNDVEYEGAAGTDGRLLSLWTADADGARPLALIEGDIGSDLTTIAGRLLNGEIESRTVVLCRLTARWSAWTFAATIAPPCVVTGPADRRASLQQALAAATRPVVQFDTQDVATPIAWGRYMSMAWQVWFQSDRVIFQLTPKHVANPPLPRPTVGSLAGSSLVQASDAFANAILKTSYDRDIFPLNAGTEHHRISHLVVRIANDMFALSANMEDLPPNRTNAVTVTWAGHPLKVDDVKAQPACAGSVSTLECAGFRVAQNAQAALVRNAFRGNPLLESSTDEIDLGFYMLGHKTLSTRMTLRDVRATNSGLQLGAEIRLVAVAP